MKQNQIRALLSPDVSPSGGAAEVDPLSGAASGWKAPEYPVLAPDRICRFEIKSAKVEPVKDDASRSLLTIQLKTTKDYVDKNGGPLRAGFPVFHRIGMTPSTGVEGRRDRTWENIGADLAMVLKACGKDFAASHEPKDLRDNPSILEGQIVDCKVSITPAKGNYGESNSVKFIQPE